MTIFQKMLAVPVLSLLLYGGFIIYSYSQQQHSSENISSIRDDYLPVLEIANENIKLFNEIRNIFKDAVLAGEAAWLPRANTLKQQLQRNLSTLQQFPDILAPARTTALAESFSRYYSNASALAGKILQEEKNLLDEVTLIKNIEHYHNETENSFIRQKHDIHQHFRQTINDTHQMMKHLLFLGSSIAVVLMLFLLIVTLLVSLSTYKRFNRVIVRMKALALGDTDFSRRLKYGKRDELSYLIHWFNKLSDKLERDYLDLETVSITDKLTQLNNRNRTDQYFPQALARAREEKMLLATVLLDIDHFKAINDQYGHLAGDRVLQQFAQILKHCAAEHDFLARWGGEEFILLAPVATANAAFCHADSIRKQILAHSFDDIGRVTASFGIAIAKHEDNPKSLLKRADACLYQAKEQGRNCVVMNQENQ